MPNQPKTQGRSVRVGDDLWQRSGDAAAAAGTDRTKVINEFLRWFVREHGAKLPSRPLVGESNVERPGP